jgi:hypothetical protein
MKLLKVQTSVFLFYWRSNHSLVLFQVTVVKNLPPSLLLIVLESLKRKMTEYHQLTLILILTHTHTPILTLMDPIHMTI